MPKGNSKIDINAMLKKVTDFFKNLPDMIKKAPFDEQAAYGVVGVGILLLIVGLVLLIFL